MSERTALEEWVDNQELMDVAQDSQWSEEEVVGDGSGKALQKVDEVGLEREAGSSTDLARREFIALTIGPPSHSRTIYPEDVTDEETVSEVAEMMVYLAEQEVQIKAATKRKLARIEEARAMLETFYAPKLAEFSLSHRPPKRKSMELDTGVLIGHTKRADKLEIVSEDLLLVWCKTHFQDAVKSTIIVKDPTIFGEIIELLQDVAENELGDCSELTSYPPGNGSDLVFSYELAVSIIKARWLATGVVPPGCEVKEECEEFFVRRAKSKNGGENEEA